jgi:hypothetical protein
MAKASVRLVKKGAAHAQAKAGSKATGGAFNIQDNQDNTLTVFGVDAAGAQVDIAGVATIEVTSDNTAALTVDPPTGMTCAFHGVAPGTGNINIRATWGDSSIGPFDFVLPFTCVAGPATGIDVTLGTPTSR